MLSGLDMKKRNSVVSFSIILVAAKLKLKELQRWRVLRRKSPRHWLRNT